MTDSLWKLYWAVWKNSFVYQGCATRREFWSFIIINLLVFFFIGAGSYFLFVDVIADKTSAGGMALVWAYFIFLPLRTVGPLILLLPVLSLGARRMHDIGKSGWWFGGLLFTEFFFLPMLSIQVYYIFGNVLDDTFSQQVLRNINMGVSIIIAAVLLWLCCKPTKIKDPASPSAVMN